MKNKDIYKQLVELSLAEHLFLAQEYKKALDLNLRIGKRLYDLFDFDSALQFTERAKICAEKTRNRDKLSASLRQKSLILQSMFRFSDALRGYNRSLEIEKEIGNREGEAMTLHQIGRLYQDMNLFLIVLEKYNKSPDSFKSLPYVLENLTQEAWFKANKREILESIEGPQRIHRNIVEKTLAGIYILQDGNFKLVNPKLGEIFGCAAKSLLDMPFWQLVKPNDMQCVSRLDRDQQSYVPVYESRVQRKDGSYRWIEFRTVPIEYEGQRAILGNILDITQRKEMEIEIKRTNRELEAIDGITEAFLGSSDDTDKDMEDALAHVISGLGGAEVGGIFLQESNGLVLRALHGMVDVMIEFIANTEPSRLLGQALIHKPGESLPFNWISAPIIWDSKAKGAIVIASADADDSLSLTFLEKAASRIGRLLDLTGSSSPMPIPLGKLRNEKNGLRQDLKSPDKA